MKFLRLLSLLALIAVVSGCASTRYTRHDHYRKVRVMDYQGHLISEWIAEGNVWSSQGGYRFKAVERLAGGPLPITTKYPYGRKVFVTGPHILVAPCGKPLWLHEVDAGGVVREDVQVSGK